MATPEAEAEETVVTAVPQTAEDVVAEAVKVEGGEKEAAVKSEEAPTSEEAGVVTEPAVDVVEKEEAAPVEPSIPAFNEESNVLSELKETEKAALIEFKTRIEKAIAGNEFAVPPPPLPKELEAPAEEIQVTAPAAETATEAPATEAPAALEGVTLAADETAPAAPEEPAPEPPVAPEPSALDEAPVAPDEPAPAAPEELEPAVPEAVAPAEPEPVVVSKEVDIPALAVESEETAPPPSEEPPAAATETKVLAKEEPVDTPPEDVFLWGVPLDPSKGDERTDVILLKFLRARDLKVNDAFTQLKNAVIWRKTFKADNLLEEEFPSELDVVAYNHGFDKQGHPVCYNVYGVFQDKDLYQKTFGDASKITDFLRWRIQVLEKGIKLLQFSPKGPSALVQITDLKNSPGPGKKELKSATNQALHLLQDNYPELVAKKVFINVPWYFSALYSFISPFLTQRTKSKFVVAPTGKTTEALLKYIAADQIPVAYGGLSRIGDTDFIPGVEAPVTETILKAGEKTTLSIPVETPELTAVWDFSAVGYDVGYEAEYVPSSGGYSTVIEKKKKLLSTTEEPIRGTFKASEAGKIVINVDNSSSRKKKIILFRYAVKTAGTEAPELAS